MKRQIKFVALAVLVVVAAVGAITALYWSKRTTWPEFPQAGNDAPQAIVRIDPDFAWRTGDKIPAHIYIRQPDGVELDLNSLAIEGDFELAGPPEVFIRHRRDGSQYVHLAVDLQSFNVTKKWSLKASMSYTVPGEKESRAMSVQAPDLYTSPTWDGRPELKDGPLAKVHGFHYLTTALALLIGLVGSLLALVYLRKITAKDYRPETIPLTRWQQARAEFDVVWSRIAAGDDSEANYKEIERIIRRLYRIESKTPREIQWELGGHTHPHLPYILAILENCGKVLYRQYVLSDAEKKQILDAFDGIVKPPAAADSKQSK